MPSQEEEGKQPLHSPTRDPHLCWGGGISSTPSAPLSLPAHGAQRGHAPGTPWISVQPNPSDQLAPGEGFASGCCSGAVWEGTGSHGGDNPCLAVPRATTFHCSLGMRDLGLHLSGLQGKVKSWGGSGGGSTPVPPLPAAFSWWWREKGLRAGSSLCRECLGRAGGRGGPLCCPSVCCIKLIPWSCPDKSFQSL